MKTAQKVFLAILVVYCVFALVMLCIISHKEYGDSFAQALYIGSLVGAIMLIFGICLQTDLNKKTVQKQEPNGEKPGALFTFMGIGQNLLGLFKFREAADTYVCYTFFCLLFPLFPTGCYRVRLNNTEVGAFGNRQEWIIFGSEKSDSKEIVVMYLYMYGLLLWIILSVMAILMSFM